MATPAKTPVTPKTVQPVHHASLDTYSTDDLETLRASYEGRVSRGDFSKANLLTSIREELAFRKQATA